MQYIKLRSSACIIQLQTGQLRRNNIREQSKPLLILTECGRLLVNRAMALFSIEDNILVCN